MYLLDKDVWQEIVDSLSRHKLRSLLTAFGVFWGIFMLVNLIGMGKGLENGGRSSFGGSGATVFFWMGRPTTIPYQGLSVGRKIRIKDRDIQAIQKRVKHIKYFSPGNGYGERTVIHGDFSEAFDVSGISADEDKVKGYKVLAGRFINEFDQLKARKTVVIGEKVKNVLFPEGEDSIGQRVQIAGISFLVVGVFAPTGTSEWAQRDSLKVMMPRETLNKVANQWGDVHWLTAVPEDGYRAEDIQKEIIDFLLEAHKVHPDDRAVIGTYNMQKDVDRWQGVFMAIAVFSWMVAIGTIIAGVIGVSNIMLIIVKERTKEIGLRKAIGATPRSIVFMIVQEAMLLTFVAGYIGLVAGVWAIEGVASLVAKSGSSNSFSNPEVSFSTAVIALVVLVIAGLFASWLPARKAAKIEPVVALQDE